MKKRVAHVVFCVIYCIFALVGLLADFGAFSGNFTTRPFVFYTSLSNMLCSTFMVFSLIRNLRRGEMELWPLGKFVFVVMILLTAIVFNLFLNSYSSVIAYFAAYKNALYHLILPLMFFLDWLIFYKRGTVKLHDPLFALIIPLVYVIYIILRACVIRFGRLTVSVLYPYFFLDVDRLGWHGVVLWIGILLAMLLLLGYGLYGMDRCLSSKRKSAGTGIL